MFINFHSCAWMSPVSFPLAEGNHKIQKQIGESKKLPTITILNVKGLTMEGWEWCITPTRRSQKSRGLDAFNAWLYISSRENVGIAANNVPCTSVLIICGARNRSWCQYTRDPSNLPWPQTALYRNKTRILPQNRLCKKPFAHNLFWSPHSVACKYYFGLVTNTFATFTIPFDLIVYSLVDHKHNHKVSKLFMFCREPGGYSLERIHSTSI